MTSVLLPEEIIMDQFTVLGEAGKSKFSVYQVWFDGRMGALKEFPKTASGITQYNKERNMIKLSHQNIIKYIPISLPQDTPSNYVLSEFAEYGNFYQLTINNVLDSEIIIRTYFRQLIEGLEYLHSQGAAHLDLKLENLMLGNDFSLKIIDFDQAQNISDKKMTSGGTQEYRAPEVINKTCTNFVAADIYSAGIILFALFAKEFPFRELILTKDGKQMTTLKNYCLFLRENLKFWEMKGMQKRDLSFYSNDFKMLINGMLDFDITKRFTLEEIKNSCWYNGTILNSEELEVEMRNRLGLSNRKMEVETLEDSLQEEEQVFQGSIICCEGPKVYPF